MRDKIEEVGKASAGVLTKAESYTLEKYLLLREDSHESKGEQRARETYMCKVESCREEE